MKRSQTLGANINFARFGFALEQQGLVLNVRHPHAVSLAVGVADVMTETRCLAANITFSRHIFPITPFTNPLFCCMIYHELTPPFIRRGHRTTSVAQFVHFGKLGPVKLLGRSDRQLVVGLRKSRVSPAPIP